MVLASYLGVPAPTSLLGSPSQGRRRVRAPSHTAPMTGSTLPLVLRGQRVPGVALRFKVYSAPIRVQQVITAWISYVRGVYKLVQGQWRWKSHQHPLSKPG
ncbi:hypothetical protein VNO77_03800 [Canavalia gladiata]|uniref:Uncharacterized protein n=1 Tax=Canavalia gladiata TaxID=3824 RepID=A0AAN9MVZ6_CANGL